MRISRSSKPLILISMGDPAGIGPEIIAKATASPEIQGLAVFVILADTIVMERALGPQKESAVFHPSLPKGSEVAVREDRINIIDPGGELGKITPGSPTDEGGRKALKCIELGASLLRSSGDKRPAALVTGPVDKSVIARSHPDFTGHTEYLQHYFSAKLTTMVFVGETLKVVPVTRHIPVKDISGALTVDLICGTLEHVIENRKLISGVEEPTIGVSSLNPHSGEKGTIGREEIDVIAPAIEKASKGYPNITGPLPADVAFYKALKNKIDIVVSMYHDQCLGPFKMLDFDNGVNMTLGLGRVRTSPDHGTAFDIAGKGIASSRSIENAIRLAVRAIS